MQDRVRCRTGRRVLETLRWHGLVEVRLAWRLGLPGFQMELGEAVQLRRLAPDAERAAELLVTDRTFQLLAALRGVTIPCRLV